jgi:hypothetical protein
MQLAQGRFCHITRNLVVYFLDLTMLCMCVKRILKAQLTLWSLRQRAESLLNGNSNFIRWPLPKVEQLNHFLRCTSQSTGIIHIWKTQISQTETLCTHIWVFGSPKWWPQVEATQITDKWTCLTPLYLWSFKSREHENKQSDFCKVGRVLSVRNRTIGKTSIATGSQVACSKPQGFKTRAGPSWVCNTQKRGIRKAVIAVKTRKAWAATWAWAWAAPGKCSFPNLEKSRLIWGTCLPLASTYFSLHSIGVSIHERW